MCKTEDDLGWLGKRSVETGAAETLPSSLYQWFNLPQLHLLGRISIMRIIMILGSTCIAYCTHV